MSDLLSLAEKNVLVELMVGLEVEVLISSGTKRGLSSPRGSSRDSKEIFFSRRAALFFKAL